MSFFTAWFVGLPQISSAFIFSEKVSPQAIVEGITATQIFGGPGTIEIAGWFGSV